MKSYRAVLPLLLSGVLVVTGAPPAVAATADGCAGGWDAPGGPRGWEFADALYPPVSCSGALGECCTGDDDWYRVTFPAGTLSSTISVTVCSVVGGRPGNISYGVRYRDGVQAALGQGPVVEAYHAYIPDGVCVNTLRAHAGTTVAGGTWYVWLHSGLGSCCNPATSYGYTLQVSILNG